MSNAEVDVAFSLLPQGLRKRIDRAFDAAIQQSNNSGQPPPKKRKGHNGETAVANGGGFLPSTSLTSHGIAPGGFIIDESQPGGFLVDDGPNTRSTSTPSDDEPEADVSTSRLPLSLVPAALQLLDLQPDDEDVLDVFRNAASGWDQRHRGRDATASSELFVERRDWHAVCTALLEPMEARGEDDEDVEMADDARQSVGESSSGSGDEYQDLGASDSPAYDEDANDSDDEYFEGSRSKAKGKQKAGSTPKSRARKEFVIDSDSENDDPLKNITPRQKKECRRTFALFFPDVAEQDLDSQRIMIKDVSRVAKLLKEKITAEEVFSLSELVLLFAHLWPAADC